MKVILVVVILLSATVFCEALCADGTNATVVAQNPCSSVFSKVCCKNETIIYVVQTILAEASSCDTDCCTPPSDLSTTCQNDVEFLICSIFCSPNQMDFVTDTGSSRVCSGFANSVYKDCGNEKVVNPSNSACVTISSFANAEAFIISQASGLPLIYDSSDKNCIYSTSSSVTLNTVWFVAIVGMFLAVF